VDRQSYKQHLCNGNGIYDRDGAATPSKRSLAPQLGPSDGANDNVLAYVESLSKFCDLDKDGFIALPYISDPNKVLHEFYQGINKREATATTKATENLSVTEEWPNSAHPTPSKSSSSPFSPLSILPRCTHIDFSPTANINDNLYIELLAGLESTGRDQLRPKYVTIWVPYLHWFCMSLEAGLSSHLDQKQDLPAGVDVEHAFNEYCRYYKGW
jgi:hypothetical protein